MSDDHPAQPATLYTQAGCAESRRVREWLTDHGIPFTERNVSADPAAARDLAATGVFATPLVVVAGDKVLGYRPRLLSALFDGKQASHRPGQRRPSTPTRP